MKRILFLKMYNVFDLREKLAHEQIVAYLKNANYSQSLPNV